MKNIVLGNASTPGRRMHNNSPEPHIKKPGFPWYMCYYSHSTRSIS